MHAKFQLDGLPGSGSFMVGDKTKQNKTKQLEASLAPAKVEVGAVAEADQNKEMKKLFNLNVFEF